MVRVIMTWDIREHREREYIDFAVSELSPRLQALGLQISDVWYTLAGNGPEMIISGFMDNHSEALALLHSREWQHLEERLSDYVEHIRVKVVTPKGPFQM
ncbi:hypothetical protein [Kallotenue papyrolyticum]|uniref:hypothetical protein n=1 Tax=Kallotenue papyrolyticum TaxID=1325125 RepID=UPI0004785CD9|nr:hypothetical protein [Kallotenue papyrolyticum]